jgi:mRNA-degrading endonuclease YafQ of YafQ-DinJ toxin-antitoxin module
MFNGFGIIGKKVAKPMRNLSKDIESLALVRNFVDNSLREILSSEDLTAISHHLERASYYCSWSHRVRANMFVVFRISKTTLTFISTGAHTQAYCQRSAVS